MAEITELAKALNEFQSELVTVGKNSDNPFFKSKYADLADIMLAAQPVLTKHGLSVVQMPDNLDGKPALTTHLMHVSGQSVTATVPLILSKEDPQGVGSAITYMRRYGYAAALQIVIDEDDDGNRASRPNQPAAKRQAKDYAKGKSGVQGYATDKQRAYVAQLLERSGIPVEDQKGYLIEQYGVDMPLTVEGASFVIAELQGDHAA